MDPAGPELYVSLFQIIWIDLVLSSDNALVIGMACRALPDRQRRWGMILGAGAATALRILFTVTFLQILAIPYIKIVGAALLLWVASHIIEKGEAKPHAEPASMWSAIRIIVLADAVMSLDNVIAIAAAARGSWPLIVFGLALSIPPIVLGATLVARALDRFPVLGWIGVGLLGWVAGEMLASDPAAAQFLHVNALAIHEAHLSLAGAIVALGWSWLRARRSVALAQT